MTIEQFSFVAGVLCMTFVITMLLHAWRSARQSREGRGTIRRWWCVAAAIALMQMTPLFACCGLLLTGILESREDRIQLVVLAASLYLLLYFLTWYILGPPLRWLAGNNPLPEVTDENFLERFHSLCERMKLLPPPVVRVIPSLSGTMETMAWVGGLPAPSVVVTDGIIYRLEPEEANSILAHELGHIANRSLWWYVSVWLIVGPIAAVLLSPFLSIMAALPLAIVMALTVRNVISRHFEMDCDLRGALAAGFDVFAQGLEKVHKTLPYNYTGFWPVVAFSMATHPLYDVRIGALADHAPADDPVSVPWSKSRRRFSLILSTVILFVWTAWLAWVVQFASKTDATGLILFNLFLTLIAPALLLRFTLKRSVKQQMHRQAGTQNRSLGKYSIGLMILIGALIGALTSSLDRLDSPAEFEVPATPSVILPLFAVGLLIFALRKRQGSQRLNLKILQALQLQQWGEVIRLGQLKPRLIDRNADLQHNVAIAKWFLGDEQEALADLADVQKKSPQLKQAYLTRSSMLIDWGKLEEALQVAECFQKAAPKDFEAWFLGARALHAMELDDDAAQMLDQADQILPDQPVSVALRASITAEKGDLEAAATGFDCAESAAPALPLVRLLAAEVTLNHGPLEEAKKQIADVARLVRAAPLSLLQRQVDRLNQRLNERLQIPSTSSSSMTEN